MRARAPGRLAVGCGAASVLLIVGVAGAGESAAVPGLGPATVSPPWDLGRHPASAAVTVVLVLAALLGTVALVLGLIAVGRGARPAARTVAAGACIAVGLLVLVPPLGSADHLSYAAYGRIAAAGDDPYVERPDTWRGGSDPVAGAAQPPWEDTPSVYGPVATALQAASSSVGGDSLRLTVWCWQLLVGAAFLATGWLLDRMVRHDGAARARAAVLWSLNPLLLGQIVLGAHVDGIAVAAATGAIALCRRAPLVAGALLGVAAGVKAPYALAGLAILWGLRHASPARALRAAASGMTGAALVLVPAHLWSGPHTYDQLGQAARFISFAVPWRLVADWLDPVFGATPVRRVVGPVALAVAVAAAVFLARVLRELPSVPNDPAVASSARAMLVMSMAWVLTAPYALPWYDAMVWAPLALAGASVLDGALTARLSVLVLAYIPGRVVGMTPRVEQVTLGFRRDVAPWLLLAVLLVIVVRLAGRARPRPGGPPGRPAPGPAR